MSRRVLLEGGLAGLLALTGGRAASAAMHSEVWLLRGFADVFSAGLDEMGAELARRGVEARVRSHNVWPDIARKIAGDHKDFGPSPIVLVGHSLGANAAIKVAERLGRQGIPVTSLISLAATDPDPLPGNVHRAVNYYFSKGGWGLPLVGGPDFQGRLSNRDYSGMSEIGHFNIDKQRSIQNEVLQLVLWSVGL